jgi:hypothetical protein
VVEACDHGHSARVVPGAPTFSAPPAMPTTGPE